VAVATSVACRPMIRCTMPKLPGGVSLLMRDRRLELECEYDPHTDRLIVHLPDGAGMVELDAGVLDDYITGSGARGTDA
jgi:hypothetical protein